MDDAQRERLEARLAEFPLVEYAFFPAEDVDFSERVRTVCRTECPQYAKTWACPPAVGTVGECRARCLRYREAFLFTTIAEVPDIDDFEACLATRGAHEDVTRGVRAVFCELIGDCLVLSTESCAICERCTYPEGRPCRHPDRMIPCVESYGIAVTPLAERASIPFYYDRTTVIWFSLVFFDARDGIECDNGV